MSLLKHYVKDGKWACDWTYELDVGIKEMIANDNEYLVAVNDSNELMLVLPQNKELIYLSAYIHRQNEFDDFCLIYPNCDVIATLAHNTITLFETSSGMYVSIYKIVIIFLQGSHKSLYKHVFS